MDGSVSKGLAVEVDVLAEYFLKLLQRDGAVSNNTYHAAVEKLKEGHDVDCNKVFKCRN